MYVQVYLKEHSGQCKLEIAAFATLRSSRYGQNFDNTGIGTQDLWEQEYEADGFGA